MARGKGRLGKERFDGSFARRKISKSGQLILIVCEGKKTEKGYFDGLKKEWQLKGSTVKVVGRGEGASGVVKCALTERAKRKQGVKYDQVWCVFDREGLHDNVSSFEEACEKAKQNELNIALSVPSFELWYLLHFRYTTKLFNRSAEVEKELSKHIEGYDKAECYVPVLLAKLEKALHNAAKLRKRNAKEGTARPLTDVDKLVRALQELRHD